MTDLATMEDCLGGLIKQWLPACSSLQLYGGTPAIFKGDFPVGCERGIALKLESVTDAADGGESGVCTLELRSANRSELYRIGESLRRGCKNFAAQMRPTRLKKIALKTPSFRIERVRRQGIWAFGGTLTLEAVFQSEKTAV